MKWADKAIAIYPLGIVVVEPLPAAFPSRGREPTLGRAVYLLRAYAIKTFILGAHVPRPRQQ